MLRLLMIPVIAFLPWAAHAAGDGKLDRATLKGLQAVSVIIDPPGAELEKQGITADLLQSVVEKRLQQAGVAVDKNAVEFLGLRLSSAQARRTPVALCASLGLYQPVLLSRDKEIRTATDTWGTASVQIVQPKVLKQSATDAINELVDRFVSAYRSVNSR